MNIDQFLAMLENVKPAGPGRWMAKCPSHEDKTASLSIRLTEDERILVHDFGMDCDVTDVCAALGIRVAELMPRSRNMQQPYLRPGERGENNTRASASDLLELLDDAAGVVWHCALEMLRYGRMRDDWFLELAAAHRKIANARAVIRPAKFRQREQQQRAAAEASR